MARGRKPAGAAPLPAGRAAPAFSALADTWKREVRDRATEVDAGNELDWFSLSVGYALAHGWRPVDAHAWAVWLRYHTDLA